MKQQLEATGDYRVIRRFVPRAVYHDGPVDPAHVRTILSVDVETTGLRRDTDKIIDFAYVQAAFDRSTGQVLRVLDQYDGLEDPGHPLSEETTRLTGIRDEDVAGQVLDDARIEAAIASSDIVIAHNAVFDRSFLERRFPSFCDKWWACSQHEGPWDAMGTGSKKLEWLAFVLDRLFFDAHRALVDAQVLLHLLSLPGPDGRTVLSHVLEATARRSYRVWADGAPFDKKDVLKLDKGYYWSDGTNPAQPVKAWFKFPVADLDAELTMLAKEIYGGKGSVIVDTVTGRERYTDRYQSRQRIAVDAEVEPSA